MLKGSGATIIDLLDIRSRRAIEEAKALSQRLARDLAGLSVERRQLIRRQVAVAVHDLEEFVRLLETERAAVVADIETLNRHRGAADAYGRAVRSHRVRPL